MIRNTALLTLLVFTFTLFAPILMQPKEAAADTCATCNIEIGDITEALEKGLEAVWNVGKGYLSQAGKHIHDKIWKHNRCSKCQQKSCSGQSTSECKLDSGDDNPAGCGEKNIWYCDDHNGYQCDNILCDNHGEKYRNCTGGHTCVKITSSTSSSYSSSYW